MTLSRELVRLMGGEVQVASIVGIGTRVRVTLQNLPAGAPEPMPLDAVSAGDEAEPEPRGVVLYIEDNEVNLLLVEQMLARFDGVTMLGAKDGISGIAVARTSQPDLVLLNMHLPDIDGFEVLARLRSDPQTRHLCVVALSASAMPDEVDRARRHGIVDYWTKPLEMRSFLDAFARLMPHAL